MTAPAATARDSRTGPALPPLAMLISDDKIIEGFSRIRSRPPLR